MPLTGEYEPSPWDWSREQADKYAESGGAEAADMKGKPIILLTTVGAKTGKIRKTPLMRVEHDGEYAVVASLGGAPKNPVWYYNIAKNPRVELQDGTRRPPGGTAPSRPGRTTRTTRRRPNARFRCSC
jgi:deazaflavin-dependent oxidoreductase (nitroreductase family)